MQLTGRCPDALVLDPSANISANSTIAEVFEYWLKARHGEVKENTWKAYQQASLYVVGPLLSGTKLERHMFARKGAKPNGAQLIELLGPLTLADLTTAQIRRWHRTLCTQVSAYTAKVAKKHLRSALALAAEDFEVRVPMMPSHRGRGTAAGRKMILSPAQIGQLLQGALHDDNKGLYYAFPFLSGTRPSEQLALLWNDIDFGSEIIQIRRMQEIDGSICELTKTAAGARDIPMSPLLKTMLIKWREICPIDPGLPKRVFPALGRPGSPNHKKCCRALSYTNFRTTYWRPAFARLQLPYVTPHSARHAFISTLQASGVEIAVVAKLAGHADPSITLSHYTQAVRDGSTAMKALEQAYIRCNFTSDITRTS